MKFSSRNPLKIIEKQKKAILNFQNLYSVYLFFNEPLFKKEISQKRNFIFVDGKILSLFLKTKQIRGPSFTKEFFKNKINKNKKYFFIGNYKREEISNKLKIPLEKTFCYSPGYTKKITFKNKEKEMIIKSLKKFKPDYVFVCVGNPKQEILSNQLFEKYPAIYFNIGAAMDFLMSKKKEAPVIFRKIGLEWFYRLITDFKHSYKKVWRSFLGLFYLNKVKIN